MARINTFVTYISIYQKTIFTFQQSVSLDSLQERKLLFKL